MESTDSSSADTNAPTLADRDVLFPKVYNDSQIEIVRRLEKEDGVVVQGPPGTGKTHTIANIVCHYLATGKNVLVVSKGEPALEVLRDQIPEEVRNLTISLTNERQGLGQLEDAVGCIDSVLDRSFRQIDRERIERAREVDVLREKIDDLDTQMKQWAQAQLTPVAKELCPDSSLLPTDLAKAVVEDASRHEWLDDHLEPGAEYDPQFTSQDIASARESRRSLGADLQYVSRNLPDPNDLPDAAAICSIHEDLVRADALNRAAETKNLPLMSTRCSNALARAQQALNEVRTLCEYLNKTSPEYPWLKGVYETWLTGGVDTEETKLIDGLVSEMGRLVRLRQPFLERPVQIPNVCVQRDVLVRALGRAELGKRPFPLLSFGNGAIKDCFHGIRVEGRKPATPSDWGHVLNFLSYQDKLCAVANRWNTIAHDLGLPAAPKDFTTAEKWFPDTYKALQLAHDTVVAYQERLRDEITTLFPYGIDVESLAREPDVAQWTVEVLETNISGHKLSSARAGIVGAMNRLESCDGPIVEGILTFLRNSVGNTEQRTKEVGDHWRGLLRELHRVLDLRGDIDTVNRVADLIESSGARLWADRLRSVPVTGQTDPWTRKGWQESWRFRRLESYLRSIDRREQLREVTRQRTEYEHRLAHAMAEKVRLLTYLGLHKRMTMASRSALTRFITAIQAAGLGMGVRARRYRGDARKAMLECMGSVPCWIMPTWRVSESLPPTLKAFNLVIVDEASQSDAMALPALLRAEKVLVVGDDKQVSPSLVGVEERELLKLRHSYLRDQPFDDMLMPGRSLYDLARAVFPGSQLLLNEHFRCVEPIINFSFRFYPKGQIVPLRIPKPSERLDPPLIDIYVSNGERNRDKVNRAEAVAIVDEIEYLTSDPAYEERSIGVVSLVGYKQARYIQNLLIERIGEDAFLRHRIACGDSATFQGKERDIMFVSMVASPGKTQAQTSRLFRQRFNVALSRARDRMYLFRSVKPEDLSNPRDLKLRVINHFRNPMPVPQADASELIELCESPFEKEVFRRLIKLGYRVTPQVAVGEFRIDLVIDGEEDRRLAVELDGDRYHGPDRWFDDWNRQKILERVGWTFWRCWGSSFALDPEACMDELVATLQEMIINPVGHEDGHHPYTEHRTATPELAGTSKVREAEDEEPEPVAEVGDRVIVSFDEDASRHFVLTLSADEDDVVNGMVSVESPAGKALLGASAEDEIELLWKGETRRTTVLRIEKELAGKEVDGGQDGAAGEDSPTAIAVDAASSGEETRQKDAVTQVSGESEESGADIQRELFPVEGTPNNTDATEIELSKYAEYTTEFQREGMQPRRLADWLRTYRKTQGRD